MRRKIVILFILIMTICLVGCSSKPDEATQIVIDNIASIGVVSLDKADIINDTLDRYKSLTDKQKEYVTNYADLLKAEDTLKELQNEAEEVEEKKMELILEKAYKAGDATITHKLYKNKKGDISWDTDIESNNEPEAAYLYTILLNVYKGLAEEEDISFLINYHCNDVIIIWNPYITVGSKGAAILEDIPGYLTEQILLSDSDTVQKAGDQLSDSVIDFLES